ncbi:MAG TPA: hypothetical protein VK251_10950 [Steroidobacteraceae bacterium]|nr:hypothetical protein [Steroidobacteraceae bacterium]
MSRIPRFALGFAVLALAGCQSSGYAVRPVPLIAADSVGKPVSRLQEVFGEPRKIETTSTKQIYVWFFAESPAGAPVGIHGCEMEVTVDAHSQQVLGYSLSNIGWSKCGEVQRKIRVAER